MKNISIACLLLLTSCNTLLKHKQDIKNISHDAVDEGVDEVIEEVQPEKK